MSSRDRLRGDPRQFRYTSVSGRCCQKLQMSIHRCLQPIFCVIVCDARIAGRWNVKRRSKGAPDLEWAPWAGQGA
ncbi:hypothetical protein SC1_04265 [Sphingopyxis sp. C-1]|nr:hypothetical protein SC1_04265 [Sphingopyxis sp. C-1]